MRYVLITALVALLSIHAHSQKTAAYANPVAEYAAAVSLYEAGVYGQAYDAFGNFLAINLPVNEADYRLLRTHAALYQAKAAIRLDKPDAELMILNFIQSHQPDPIATEATIEVADYYFNARNYEKAIAYYKLLNARDLTHAQYSKVRFKQGYSHFVLKEFADAEVAFAEIREITNTYYYPSNYYYGMCRFFAGDYDAALRSFERVSTSKAYDNYVPYYITQIYFAQDNYDQVISYGKPKLEIAATQNRKDIHHLVGQAYFERGEYAEALPHLEYYESRSGSMRAEDFYQLAYVQYSEGACDKATRNFANIAQEESVLGQRAQFYIADCALKSGDLHSARNAFRAVSKMEYDRNLQREALFQFGKLSAQMDYDFDAIQALDAINSSSPFYSEAQSILREVFANARDYKTTLETLNTIPSLSPTLKEAHQRLCLNYGLQLLIDEDIAGSLEALRDAQKYPVDQGVTAQSLFWRAEIAHYQERYAESIDLLNQYFTIAKNITGLPAESSIPVANYNQGYNYLKKDNHAIALGHYQDAIAGMKRDQLTYREEPYYYNHMLPDALLRAGDCQFKRNRYSDALRYYDEAIIAERFGYVYAKYQKALISGLQGDRLDKVLQLEDLIAQHPTSQFADDAILQLAITYQEMGSPEKALPALEKLVEHFPTSELLNQAYLQMGLISYNNGDINAASNYYKRVLQGNPSATEAQEALAALEEIYVRDLSQPDEYFAYLDELPGYTVSDLQRDSVSFHAAEIQYENGAYERAVDAFSDYLSTFPNGASALAAHYYRGESLVILKRYSEGLEDFASVVNKGASGFYQRALTKAATISYHHAGDFDKARTYYKELAKITKDTAELFDVQLGLMRSAYRTGHQSEAIAAARYVTEYSGATQSEIAEGRYYLGKAAFDAKDYDKALTHFNAVTRNSNNVLTAEARYLIAYIYYLRRQLDLAEQICHNATSENANYPHWVAKGLILLSDIYVDKGDLLNARAPLEALIENFQGDTQIVAEAQRKLRNIETLQQEQNRVKASSDTLELETNNNDN